MIRSARASPVAFYGIVLFLILIFDFFASLFFSWSEWWCMEVLELRLRGDSPGVTWLRVFLLSRVTELEGGARIFLSPRRRMAPMYHSG